MKLQLNRFQINILLALFSALLFVPFLGGVHLFDWDEINFAESAREMIVSGDYLTVQINFQPFWEKPPLFLWMQVLSMKTFGVNEFAARFPNAICGITTVLVLFNLGINLRNKEFGLFWVAAFIGSVLPFFYFKSGIIDPWFNLFIFLGIVFLIQYFSINHTKMKNAVFAAFFIGLAVLTKGPVAILLTAITAFVYLIFIRFKTQIRLKDLLIGLLVLMFVGGFWFILQIIKGNFYIIEEFIDYQVRLFKTRDAGHGGFFGYHFVVLLFGVFPSSVWAIKTLKKDDTLPSQIKTFKQWMIVLLLVVLIVFTIVRTKIVHYSSLAYFPISFLAALYIFESRVKKYKASKWQNVLLVSIASLYFSIIILFQVFEKVKSKILDSNLISDLFTRESIKANVHWSGFEFIPAILFLITIIVIFGVINRNNLVKRGLVLWAATLFFMASIMTTIVPKIEQYSQAALIEFFKSKANEDVYLRTLYFKSYATYFYGKTQPPKNVNYYNDNWLLTGDIDKDAYFVAKIHHENKFKNFPDIKKIGEKNGFIFYLRKAK